MIVHQTTEYNRSYEYFKTAEETLKGGSGYFVTGACDCKCGGFIKRRATQEEILKAESFNK